MAATIIPKNSTTSGAVPGSASLAAGEIAVNSTDGIIYTKLPDGNVVNLSGAPELHNHQISQVEGLQGTLDSKVDKVSGKALSDENYTSVEKTKLGGIEEGAQVNVPTNLDQSRTGSTYTVTSSTGENTILQSASTTLSGVMTAADRVKLDGIEAGAEVNVITTVNTKTGDVVLGSDDIDEGATNLYFTDVRAVTAIKNDVDWKDANWNTAYGWGDHSLAGYELASNKGIANGYAGLGGDGKVPSAQLPSFVDDVLEYSSQTAFPATGETGKLYVALDTDKVYRWSGTTYVYITSGAVDSVNGQDGVVNLTTSNIGEGTNQYFTTARARAAISVAGDLSYSAGVISFSETYGTPAELLTAIKTVDGSGSGLDADLLDGVNSASFLRSDVDDVFTGTITNKNYAGTAFRFAGRNDDLTLFRVAADDGESNSSNYGFSFLYKGTDTGDTTTNFIWRTGQTSVGQIEAFTIKQDGSLWHNGVNKIYHAGNDGVGSGLDADRLDGQQGAYYRNASNLNAGTVPEARLPASALASATTYSAGTGLTLTDTTFSLTDERYTLSEKNKLGGIAAGAEVNTVDSVNSKTGAVTIGKADVGLGSVRNVSSYSQTEADGRFVNDTGDSMTGTYRINTPDDGVNDLQVGGNVSLRGQTGFGTDNPTHTVDVAGDVRVRNENAVKFGGSGVSDTKASLQYNSVSKSMEFNFT